MKYIIKIISKIIIYINYKFAFNIIKQIILIILFINKINFRLIKILDYI